MMVPEYDMHVHTVFSGHAHESATVARLAVRADELRMRLVCFSEHVHDAASLEALSDWRWQIGQAQRGCSCRLLTGGEVDADPIRSDGSLTVEVPSWMDFVIASAHYIPGTDIFPDAPLDVYHLDAGRVLEQWRTTVLGLARHPRVDMIGHPGVLLGILLRKFPDRAMAVFREAAAASAAHGQYWDFNDLAFVKLAGLETEYCQVLQTAIDAGVTLLYGSDAHALEHLGRTDNVFRALSGLRGLNAEQLFRLPDRLAKRFTLQR